MISPCLSRLSAVSPSHALLEEGEFMELVAAEIPLGLRDDWHEQLDVCHARLQALVKAEGSLCLEEAVNSDTDTSEGVHRLRAVAKPVERATRDLEEVAQRGLVEEFPLNPSHRMRQSRARSFRPE